MTQPDADRKSDEGAPRLSPSQATNYALGGIAQNIMGNVLNQLVYPIFSDGLGLSKWLVSLGFGIPRVLDAIIDPWIGHLSDNHRGRFGRRKPFMFAGGALSAIAFAFLWLPASGGWGTTETFIWFMVFTTLFYIGFGLFNIPYSALAYEIAETGRSRTRLLTYKNIIIVIASVPLSMTLILCMYDWGALLEPGSIWDRCQALTAPVSEDSGAQSSQLPLGGIMVVGAIVGVLIFISALAPLLCRETRITEGQPHGSLWATIKESIRCPPFLLLNIGIVLAFIGVFLVMPMAFYVNLHYVYSGDMVKAGIMTSAVGIMQGIVGVVASLVTAWLLNRIGAYRGMLLCLLVVIASHIMTYWMYTPANPWLQLIPMGIWVFAWTGVMLAYQVMLGDCCDYDELQTGLRRQGSFSAVTAFLTKIAIGITQALAGLVLASSGIVEGAVRQSESTISLLRYEYAIIPSLFIGLAFVVFLRYPLRGNRPEEIRDELRRRHSMDTLPVHPKA